MSAKIKTKAMPKTRKEKAVWEACEALLAQNCQPTYLAIGEQLIKMGHRRGSNSDIRRYLTSWKEQTPAGKNVKKNKNLPTTSPSPLMATESLSHPQISLQQLISLYHHHNRQIDRLLHVIELQKIENQKLRDKLAKSTKPSACKPRIKITP